MGALGLLKGLFIWLALSSFFFGSGKEEKRFVAEDYVSMVHDIIAKTAKKVSKELGADCCGTGGGMMDSVYEIAMRFRFYQHVDLEQARELIVEIANRLLFSVNNNIKIRKYLHNFPFDEKNISVIVSFVDPRELDLDSDAIKVAHLFMGEVEFERERDNPADPPWRRELFEESVQLVGEYRKQKTREGKR